MPLFKFKVADRGGGIQEILVEGNDQNEATRRVRSRQLIPVEFLGAGDAGAGGGKLSLNPANRFDVVDFTDRLVPLLDANIPLERALGILEETSETATERELISSLRGGLHEGRKLSQLIRDRGRMFPRMYASVVEAGEESGALPQVLSQLRQYLIMTREMRSFIISSMVYPCFVLSFSLVVILVLLGVVVPKFERIQQSLGVEPNLFSRGLFTASFLVNDYWWVGLLGLTAGLGGLIYMLRKESTREALDRLLLRLPLFQRIVILSNIGRQVRTMSILMRSGVHLLDTVSIAAGTLQNTMLRNSISTLAMDLRRGERLSAALGRSPYIPPLVIRMLAVGEETGETDVMLERVADRYDNDLRQIVKKALSWFEPLVIIAMGAVVGLIVLSLFLLIMQFQGSV